MTKVIIKAADGTGAVDLYHDAAKKVETTSSGATVTGQLNFTAAADPNISLRDDGKIAFGVGDDMKIFHNGTDSLIDSNTGKLKIDSVGGVEVYGTYLNVYKAGGSETIAEFAQDGACKFYYDNSKKLETTNTGSTITGDLTVNGSVTASNFSGRNIISNGEFLIAQRSTAAVTTSSGSNEGYQTVDRWQIDMDGTTAAFTQQQVDLTAATDPDGFYKAWKIDCTTADASVGAGDWASLLQNVEGLAWARLNYGRSDAKTITVSFWVKSTKTGTYSFSIRNSAANRYYIAEYTVSASDTWEKKTITIAGDTSGTWLTTNGIGARLGFSLIIGSTDSAAAGSWTAGNKFGSTNQVNFFDSTSNDFYITGVQLEVGSTATEFEHRFYGDELARCQRYYIQYDVNSGRSWQGRMNGTGNSDGEVDLPVDMRAEATGTVSFDSAVCEEGSSALTVNGLACAGKGHRQAWARCTLSSSGTNANATYMRLTGTSKLMYSAEL